MLSDTWSSFIWWKKLRSVFSWFKRDHQHVFTLLPGKPLKCFCNSATPAGCSQFWNHQLGKQTVIVGEDVVPTHNHSVPRQVFNHLGSFLSLEWRGNRFSVFCRTLLESPWGEKCFFSLSRNRHNQREVGSIKSLGNFFNITKSKT